MLARHVCRDGDAGVGGERGDEALEHRAVSVRRLDEELGLGAAALGLEVLEGRSALVRMHGQVAEEAEALAVESARHERHENRRGADPRHDAQAKLLGPCNDLCARIRNAGTARLADDRGILAREDGLEPAVDQGGVGIMSDLLDPELRDGAGMAEQLQVGARILGRLDEKEADVCGAGAHGGRNGGFQRAVGDEVGKAVDRAGHGRCSAIRRRGRGGLQRPRG